MEGIRTASRLEGETAALSERVRTHTHRRSSAGSNAAVAERLSLVPPSLSSAAAAAEPSAACSASGARAGAYGSVGGASPSGATSPRYTPPLSERALGSLAVLPPHACSPRGVGAGGVATGAAATQPSAWASAGVAGGDSDYSFGRASTLHSCRSAPSPRRPLRDEEAEAA